MGHRISKVYTRTGDDGTTGMADGMRVAKDDSVIEAIGDIDELNSCIGVLRSEEGLPDDVDHVLLVIQHHLFNLGGELSSPGYEGITKSSVDWLEQQIDQWNEALPPLKEFILPAGSKAIARCHVCRAVCRRAERHLSTAGRDKQIRLEVMGYMNRLSDTLFVMARQIAVSTSVGEVFWRKAVVDIE